MSRCIKRVLVSFAVLAVAAQFVRPERADLPIDPARTIESYAGTPGGLAAVLDRACADCHSNRTSARWYTRVAPASWLMARGVREGRKAVNFSEWSGYPAELQRALLAASCQDASAGRMPGPYSWLRPDTRLSPTDVETICAAARQSDAVAQR